MKNREITVVMDIEDCEAPELSDIQTAEAIKNFIVEQFGVLQFGIKNITVTSKS